MEESWGPLLFLVPCFTTDVVQCGLAITSRFTIYPLVTSHVGEFHPHVRSPQTLDRAAGLPTGLNHPVDRHTSG